jgi:nucleotide-binding universal stress UspA family protein
MEKLKSEMPKSAIEINYLTWHSDLIPALKRLSEEGADFFVMGTKGATGLEGVIFGSNTVSAIKNIKKPVLIIGQNIEKININHIVLAHDNKEFTNQEDVQILNEIILSYNSSITLLNVIDPQENHLDRQEKLNRYQLISEIKSNDIRVKVVKNDSVVDGIHQFVNEHPTELLVLIKRDLNMFEKLFHKSVTTAISKKADIPLLILHN